MRQNFGKRPLIYPQPVLMIATYNEDNRGEYVYAAKLLMEQQGIQLVKKI